MLGEVPEGWSVKPLDEIADLIMGQSPPSSAVAETGDGLPFIQGNAEFGARHPTPRFVASTTPKVVRAGDVLISVRAPVGEVNIAEAPLCIGRGVGGLRAKDCDPEFLFYAVGGLSQTFARLSQGSTFDAINGKELRSIEILLPPLDEQRRIAEVLRSVDDALSFVEHQAQQAQTVLSAHSSSVFAGAVVNDDGGVALEDLLSHVIDYRGVPPPKAAAGVPLLTAKNVRFGYLDPEPREFIAEDDFDSWMRRGLPTAGDVMFTTEAPLGNVANFPSYRAALGQRTLTLRPKPDRLTSNYLKWLLLSPNAQDIIQRHGTGSTAKGIKQSTFRKLRFNVPSLDEQVAVGVACEAIWAIVVEARDQISIMRDMRSMLSADLLSGRVRVPA